MNNEDFVEALKDHARDDARQFEAVTDALAGIAKDIGRLSESVHEMRGSLEKVEKRMEPLMEAYNGVIFGKKLITGLAAVIVALAAIGGGVIWIVNAARR